MTDTHTETPHPDPDADTGTAVKQPNVRRPMGIEMWTFIGLAGFFVPVALLYGFWSSWEPVGSTALGLLVGMWLMVGFYLGLQSRKIDARPEDDPAANIEDNPASDYGHFAPHSWWPFVAGIAVTLIFGGIAVGWWIFGIGLAVGVIALVGHVFEFSRGPHAH